MDFYLLLEDMKNTRPDHVVFSYYEGENKRDITVKQWIQDIYSFASWIQKRNLVDHKIGIACVNRYEWYVVVFGMAITGNIAVAFNPNLSLEELVYQIDESEIDELYYDKNTDLEEHIYELKDKITLMDLDSLNQKIIKNGSQKYTKNIETNIDKTVLILFSSGSSGFPKGVMLSQKNLLNVCEDLTDRFAKERAMILIPMYHVGGIFFSLNFMRYSVTICIGDNSRYLVRDIVKFKPTVMCLVPSQLDFIILKCKKNKEFNLVIEENLKYVLCAGAPICDEHESFLNTRNIEIGNVYGLTEVAGGVTCWFPRKRGSAGRFSLNNEMRIVDGELAIRGASVMNGYYNRKEEEKNSIRDGWFYTGDLVEVDENGYIYIIGRCKNIIILSNGENISPEVLEHRIKSFGILEEVIVTGRNDVLEAVVYCGTEVSDEKKTNIKNKIKDMNRELPRFEQIQRVTFLNHPFDKTGSGKIKRI